MIESKPSLLSSAQVDGRIAYVALRVTMGINFLGHGTIRLLHGNAEFAHGMVRQMAETPLPAGFVYGFGWILPILEFLIGVFLIAGLLTRWALIAGLLLIMALMVGVTLRQDWATAGSQLVYSLIFSVLLFLRVQGDVRWLDLVRRTRSA